MLTVPWLGITGTDGTLISSDTSGAETEPATESISEIVSELVSCVLSSMSNVGIASAVLKMLIDDSNENGTQRRNATTSHSR